jgi:hypothetical protein
MNVKTVIRFLDFPLVLSAGGSLSADHRQRMQLISHEVKEPLDSCVFFLKQTADTAIMNLLILWAYHML